MRRRGGWRSGLIEGVTGRGGRPGLGASRWREAWRRSEVAIREPDAVGWAKDDPQSNNGMHPTAGTLPVKFLRGVARRVMPGVMRLAPIYAAVT
jgi:hypothetical protein